MNLLITGGAGFIGRHFTRMAAGFADRVLMLDALTYAGDADVIKTFPKNVTSIIGNTRDAGLLVSLIRKHDITHVVHLAAETHVDRSISGPEAFVRTNILGTSNLLAAVRQADRAIVNMVYVSTDEVYGSRESGLSVETDSINPSSPYSASKAAGEMLCMAEHRTFNLPICITRGTNTYGPGQHAEKFIPTIIRKILDGEPVPIYGDGEQSRDWMHIDDHCSGIWAALIKGTPGEIYNIGVRNVMTNMQLVCAIGQIIVAMGGTSNFYLEHVTDRKGHDRRYAVDPGKLDQLLDWSSESVFGPSLQETVRSYMP